MAKRASLSTAMKAPVEKLVEIVAPQSQTRSRVDSRQGKVQIAVYVSTEAYEQLKMLGFKQKKTNQKLLEEGIDLVFQQNGLTRLASAPGDPSA